MIELRYVYREGSDSRILQYRTWNVFRADGMALPLTEDNIRWSKWKSIDGAILSTKEYEKVLNESRS